MNKRRMPPELSGGILLLRPGITCRERFTLFGPPSVSHRLREITPVAGDCFILGWLEDSSDSVRRFDQSWRT
jgi:hypothetical protein